MAKNESLTQQQNNLLERQNFLLEKMTDLLQQQNKIAMSNRGGVFVDNIDTDEIRSGFLVTSHKKKLWNVQIGLINEFARVCKKYNLRWFAFFGTLLGAVRHKGFIPWDDDVDLAMLRSDYEKFLKIANKELEYPCRLDAPYNYRYEGDKNPSPEESNLPLIKIDEKYDAWPFALMCKIRDISTTMIEFPKRKTSPQGIWIDIFPLDAVPPFDEGKKEILFQMKKEIAIATLFPEVVHDAIEKNFSITLDVNEMKNFLKKTYRQKYFVFEDFMTKYYFDSKYVGWITPYIFSKETNQRYDISYFEKTIYLPFEKIELPAPAEYDKILTETYGDWHQMKITHSHSLEWSVDIPYTEYFKHSAV